MRRYDGSSQMRSRLVVPCMSANRHCPPLPLVVPSLPIVRRQGDLADFGVAD